MKEKLKLCKHCGSVFYTETNAAGEVGVIENIRFIPWKPHTVSRWRMMKFWLAQQLRVVQCWLERQ